MVDDVVSERRYLAFHPASLKLLEIRMDGVTDASGLNNELNIIDCTEFQDDTTIGGPHCTTTMPRLTLIVTNRCNMRCTYCYEEGTAFRSSTVKQMPLTVAINAIDRISSIYDGIDSIMFFGGEPFLVPDIIGAICEYVDQHAKLPTRPRFTLITNGTVWNDKIDYIVRKFSINVTISHDGPAAVHDAVRKKRSGKGTYADICRHYCKIKDAAESVYIESTYNRQHIASSVDVINMIDHVNETFGVFNPHITCASELGQTDVREAAVEAFRQAAANFLSSLTSTNVRGAYSFATGMLQCLINKQFQSTVCPAGKEIAIDAEGYIYPCFVFAGEEHRRIGHIDSDGALVIDQARWEKFMELNRKDNRSGCRDCWVRGLCHGCLGANERVMGNIRDNLPEHCEIMKVIAKEVIVFIYNVQKDDSMWRLFKTHYEGSIIMNG